MKYQILIEILFILLAKRKVSATELAERFGVSQRTIYRYIMEIELANIPVIVTRGKNGGYAIAESYKFPSTFFTEKEFATLISIIDGFQKALGSNEDLQNIKDKLKCSTKSGSAIKIESNELIIDGSDWFNTSSYNDKLSVLINAIHDKTLLSIRYHDRNGVVSTRKIEPHALALKHGVWYVYAFCQKRNGFRLFKIGRIEYANPTGTFTRKEFNATNLSFKEWFKTEKTIEFEFEISKSIKTDVEEWLGIENVKIYPKGKIIASAELPYDKGLVYEIMKFGDKIKVTKPEFVKQEIHDEAQKLLQLYN